MNATTPQLKAVDRFFAAYRSCDLKIAEPLMAKNYTFKTLPRSAKVPDLTSAEHIEKFGPMFASLTKIEHTFHQVIEAPGKVVVHWTALLTPRNGAPVEREFLAIVTLVEEDGELKVLEYESITDPETRSSYHKVLGQGGQSA